MYSDEDPADLSAQDDDFEFAESTQGEARRAFRSDRWKAAKGLPSAGGPYGKAGRGLQGITLKVRHAETREPLPGCEVFVADNNKERQLQRIELLIKNPRLLGDPAALALRVGRRWTSNSKGEAFGFVSTGFLTLAVKSPNFVGVRTVHLGVPLNPEDSRDEVITLLAFPLLNVRARLLNDEGEVAKGLNVRIFRGGVPARQIWQVPRGQDLGAIKASVSLGHDASSGASLPPSSEPTSAWVVDGVFRKPQVFEIVNRLSSEDPQILRLPPYAYLDLELVTPKGVRLEDPVSLKVAMAVRPGESSPGPQSHGPGSFLQVTAQKGRARIGPVGLGIQLKIQAEPSAQSEFEAKSFYLETPTQSESPLGRVLQWDKGRRTMVGRILDDTGVPKPHRTVELVLSLMSPGGSVRWRKAISSDALGNFRFPFPKGAVLAESVEASLQLIDGDPYLAQSSYREVSKVFSFDADQELIDAADLVLSAPAVLAEGKVVDDLGAPLSGVRVTATMLLGRRSGKRSYLPSRLGNKSAAVNVSDRNGHFRLLSLVGDRHDEVLSLQFRKSGYVRNKRHSIRRGETNIVLSLTRTGMIKGKILLSKEMKRTQFMVALSTDGKVHPRARRRRLSRTGDFSALNVPPGNYSLFLLVDGQQVVTEVCDVDLAPGETLVFEDVDLRSRLHAFKLTFVDARQKPLRGVVLNRVGAAVTPKTLSPLKSSKTKLYFDSGTVDLRFSHGNYLSMTQRVSAGGTTIAFQNRPKVRLRLDLNALGLSSKESLRVSFVKVDRLGLGEDSASFSANGEAVLSCGELGRRALRFMLIDDSRGFRPAGNLMLSGSPFEVVVSMDAQQSFDLGASEALREAIGAARRKMRR